MTFINTVLKVAQVYVALKICTSLYLVHYSPKQHSIDNVLWWVSVLILDIWLNLIVFKSGTIILKNNDNNIIEQ